MSTRSVEVVILCEDRQQEVFIRRFLKRRKDNHSFRPLISPAGRGSGEQWVRERFPRELQAYRSQSARRRTWLIVATDADRGTVNERVRSFRQACETAGIPFRTNDERVVFVIPKRSIETWFEYLRGRIVNESDEYPRYACENDCRGEVDRLDALCLQGRLEPEPRPPSLIAACDEFGRISD